MRILKKALLGAAAATLLTAGTASASSLTFQLTSDHCTGTGGCLGNLTSGGTIVVSDTAVPNQLTFTITLASGYTFVNTGFDATFGFNLDPNQTITYSSLTSGFDIVGGVGNTQTAAAAPGLHMDGTGFFEYGVLWHLQGGGNGTTGPLSFTITGTNLTLASIQQNALNQYFAVDVFGNGNTGALDASISTVPDGGTTVGLLGLGMLGLGYLRRRIS